MVGRKRGNDGGSEAVAGPAKVHRSALELQREKLMARNAALMEQFRLQQAVEAVRKVHEPAQDEGKEPQRRKVRAKREQAPVVKRRSARLQCQDADEVEVDEDDRAVVRGTGKAAQPAPAAVVEEEELEPAAFQEGARRGVLCPVLGISCHFCRQKTLCGTPGCPRCQGRDREAECIGKSRCQRCNGGTGVFCVACLDCRYGLTLEETQRDGWLCAHCYEEEHPDEGWFCNSSFCMKKRELRPTGQVADAAKRAGWKSAQHEVQAQWMEMPQALRWRKASKFSFNMKTRLEEVKAAGAPPPPGPLALGAPGTGGIMCAHVHQLRELEDEEEVVVVEGGKGAGKAAGKAAKKGGKGKGKAAGGEGEEQGEEGREGAQGRGRAGGASPATPTEELVTGVTQAVAVGCTAAAAELDEVEGQEREPRSE